MTPELLLVAAGSGITLVSFAAGYFAHAFAATPVGTRPAPDSDLLEETDA